jgi:hypothetical protein
MSGLRMLVANADPIMGVVTDFLFTFSHFLHTIMDFVD